MSEDTVNMWGYPVLKFWEGNATLLAEQARVPVSIGF